MSQNIKLSQTFLIKPCKKYDINRIKLDVHQAKLVNKIPNLIQGHENLYINTHISHQMP